MATLVFISLFFSLLLGPVAAPAKITLNDLVARIHSGEVSEIKVNGEDLNIVLKDGTKLISKKETEAGITDTLKNLGVDALDLQGVDLAVESQSGWQFWLGILIPTLLPILIIGFIFCFCTN